MRVCLRDKLRRVSGLARPWRVPALVGALDADPETIPDLLVSAQRFFYGHPVRHHELRRDLRGRSGARGSIAATRRRRPGTGSPCSISRPAGSASRRGASGGGGRAGSTTTTATPSPAAAWRTGSPSPWLIEGVPADRAPQVEWNDGGPEPFEYLVAGGG